MKRRTLLTLAPALPLAGILPTTHAQEAAWPTRPVRIIVGFPAGSSPDLTARLFAEPLARALGQPVVVDNKVGAGGNIGADAVAKARDGHTIGLFINGNLTIADLINPKLPYQPHKDFAPLSLLGVSPLVLTAPRGHKDVPESGDVGALLDAARKAGDKWSYGTPGVGTVGHLGMEMLKEHTGIAPLHIPYPGYAQVAAAMLSGELQLALLPPALALAQERTGKLRRLGVTSRERSPLAPDIPSLAEAGVKGMQFEMWNAFAAPISLPVPARERLTALAVEIAQRPEIREKMLQQGWQAVGSTAPVLGERIAADTHVLGDIIRKQGISLE